MNAVDILKYGHRTFLSSLEGLTPEQAGVEGVCGWWSVRHIVAHIASYEHVLTDVLSGFLGSSSTPALDTYRNPKINYNDSEVGAREGVGYAELLDEYVVAHDKNMGLVARVQPEVLSRVGTLGWYGNEYAVDDFIVYAYYGHKREHAAQVNVYRDTLKK